MKNGKYFLKKKKPDRVVPVDFPLSELNANDPAKNYE